MDFRAVLRGEKPVASWVEYVAGVEFLLEPSTAERQRKSINLKRGAAAVNDAATRDYWLGHVKSLRVDGVEAAPDSVAQQARYAWDTDPSWCAWLVAEVQNLEHFRSGPRAADAGSSSTSQPAA